VTDRTPEGGDAEPGPRSLLQLTRLTKRQRAKLARGGRVKLRAQVNKAGRLRAVATARIGKRSRVVWRATKSVEGEGAVAFTVRLSKPAQRTLVRRGRLRVNLRVRFTGLVEPRFMSIGLRAARKGR
jgi:hypothetical protein